MNKTAIVIIIVIVLAIASYFIFFRGGKYSLEECSRIIEKGTKWVDGELILNYNNSKEFEKCYEIYLPEYSKNL